MAISFLKYSVILFLVFVVGCIINTSNEKVLLYEKLSDGTSLIAVSYSTLSTSPNYIWIIRKYGNGKCYLTGKADASTRFNEIKIDKVTDSGFILMINYPITQKESEWVDFKINFKDTFCLNNDCLNYPVNCDF